MSSLTMVEAKLPPGFRFHPRDDELVCDYLIKKWNGCEPALLIEVDLNKCEPWDIPATACVGGKEWYFFNQRDRKYATGLRTNRATATGYWKATGKDRPVVRKGSLVGMRKTLVFYEGRAPKGKKTDWVMHEFRVEGPFGPPNTTTCTSKQEDWVLCRVFYKSRSAEVSSPKSGGENDTISVEETSSSTGLPPLMDSYITFDQTQVNANHNDNDNSAYQQVPCFSITSSSTNPNHHHYPNPISIFPQNYHMHDPNNNSSMTRNHHHHHNNNFGGNIMPDDSSTNNLNPTLACDKKVLEAVLTHLTKMETSPNINGTSPSFGEVASSQTYLSSDIALPPHMWNHY